MVKETDLRLSDGRTLHIYDTGAPEAGASLTVFWHHGTPNTGAPPEPLFPAAAERGIRWVSHDRPGYGASTPQPGRDVAAVAADVAATADALGIGSFVVMGHSGGGPHALACAARPMSSTWPPPSGTRRYSPRPITPRWPATGPGWGASRDWP